MSTVTVSAPAQTLPAQRALGMRKNGKNWHGQKRAFRPTAGLSTFAQRMKRKEADARTKEKEKELKEIKESERSAKIEAIKSKRAAKEERERYELLEAKMHKKRVERLKRKEKRNKLLKSR